jgi:glycosyltransferase involved in cell wall biosynthesis
MRILMCSDDFLPNPGGIAGHVFELSRALAAGGHEVDLIAGHNRIHAANPWRPPAGVRIVSNEPFAWSVPGYVSHSVGAFRRLREESARRAYDVVHWHNLVWEPWAVRFGAGSLPRVFTNHSSGFLRRMKVPWRRKIQLPLILGIADRIIAPSTELRERTIDAGIPPGRVDFIGNGVDVEDFSPGPRDAGLAARFGISGTDRVLVVPRRLDPKNGVDVLVKALPLLLARHAGAKVLLVGDGPEKAHLEALAASSGLGDRLVFCGSQPRHLMPAHLRLGEFAVLPSRKEAISLAGLEAMACGLPVAGSRVGGIPEFVSDPETGRLVPPDDPPALAAALADLLELRPEGRRAMAERARRSVADRFSWTVAAERTVGTYRAAIAGKRRPAQN